VNTRTVKPDLLKTEKNCHINIRTGENLKHTTAKYFSTKRKKDESLNEAQDGNLPSVPRKRLRSVDFWRRSVGSS
jgi:hypothetical protein